MYSLEELIEMLREREYKLTPQRITIIKVLLREGKEHPSINYLLAQVKRELPTTSFSTLYTTLLRLEELGIIKLFSYKGETRVEIDPRPHINVIYTKNDKIVDVYDQRLIEDIKKRLDQIYGNRHKNILINVIVY